MATNGASGGISLDAVLKAAKAKTWNEAVSKLGYADHFGLEQAIYDFWIKLADPEEIHRILTAIGGYNEFEGQDVADMMVDLIGAGVVMYIEFGRRGSPELHVFVREPAVYKDRVREALARLRPSELRDYGPMGLRAWWE